MCIQCCLHRILLSVLRRLLRAVWMGPCVRWPVWTPYLNHLVFVLCIVFHSVQSGTTYIVFWGNLSSLLLYIGKFYFLKMLYTSILRRKKKDRCKGNGILSKTVLVFFCLKFERAKSSVEERCVQVAQNSVESSKNVKKLSLVQGYQASGPLLARKVLNLHLCM